MSREQVVLLHGLAETPFHMAALALALRLDGYEVANVAYPSTVESTEALAKAWLMPLFERFAGAERLHFVTHSMGGVMLHRGLLELRPANLGRVVMQTSAAHGSPFLEAFRPTWLYRMIFGPAGQEAG
ncbi:MAG: hypothetical protein JF615_12370, partial [Asticcacaulis sp.]|nr:hypothetical protein [Asticcacaulis sp.]